MPPPAVTYQLRVVLRGTSPPIWRRILVSPSMTLARLHDVLQVVMGWDDCHLHMFVKGERRFSPPDPWGNDWTPPGMPRDLDERKCRVRHLLEREKEWFDYEYDFGDSWSHRITLQKILPRDPKQRLPACISGKRRCPPEDSGGSWLFQEKLEIRDDPDHEDHEWISEWMGEDFDAEAFSVRDVNERLRYMFR
ncbi:plasmid pRiA4b ORF-3 family protein [Candidatus Palauibacter sp.]|uniref:plasmid pRiA4b ORF-3 family protein n=1 Tax=Candidatus Palauibacter sp. TaxID=3101350 RepID=UPI003C700BAA